MIDCPVDGRKNITTSSCPQCHTDLSPLIYIRELPEELYKEGMNLFDQKQFDKAAEKFINACSISPGNSKYLLVLARIFFNKGLIKEALAYLEEAKASDPHNKEVTELIEECNRAKAKKIRGIQKEINRKKKWFALLIILPIICLGLGLIIPVIFHGKIKVTDDIPAITRAANRSLAGIFGAEKLNISLFWDGKAYVLKGQAPTELHKKYAEEVVRNASLILGNKDSLSISNNIVVQEKPLVISYIIKKKDNLWKIARFFYGDPAKWLDIVEYNKDQQLSLQNMQIGQQLKIPVSVGK